jgi:hypothetical protein
MIIKGKQDSHQWVVDQQRAQHTNPKSRRASVFGFAQLPKIKKRLTIETLLIYDAVILLHSIL